MAIISAEFCFWKMFKSRNHMFQVELSRKKVKTLRRMQILTLFSLRYSRVKFVNFKFLFRLVRLTHYGQMVRCCLSIPPENIRKPLGFLMFSGDIDKQHRALMVNLLFLGSYFQTPFRKMSANVNIYNALQKGYYFIKR